MVKDAALVLLAGLLGLGCSERGRSYSSSTGAASTPSATTSGSSAGITSGTSSPIASATPSFAQLAAEMQARKRAYLQHSATGGGYYAQISRLSVNGGPVDRAPLESMMDFMDRRPDTADFKAAALVRLVYLHGSHPDLPADLQQRARRTLLGFKYWVDEPGQDEMIFWSENHQILFASSEYLAGQLYPQDVFQNDGQTGAQHMAKAKPRILRWLDERLRFGFSEWYSPVYYAHELSPLLNLVDFAQDPQIKTRAEMVLDLVVFDLARLTNRGSFGVTAGRVSEPKYAFHGRNQSVGDAIEVLFGTRGSFRSRGSTAATPLATSTYRVPPVLLAIGKDTPARMIDRSRVSIDFNQAASEGIGFQTLEDGIFWWGLGAMGAPDVIALSKRVIDGYDLWNYSYFGPLRFLRSVPDPLISLLASPLRFALESPVLSQANTYTFRTPDAMLSSVQSYRKGQVGAQQLAWIATLDLGACVWTTAPGNQLAGSFGAIGEWNGSSSQPHVVQHEDVAVVLYNPPTATRLLFGARTHAWFPRAEFDEVTSRGSWTFGRKGKGYVALYSAQPTTWTTSGTYADQELDAPGHRNVWVCQVGNEAEDGTFAAFVSAVASAPLQTVGQGNGSPSQPLSASYQAPGLGQLDVSWRGAPTLNGAAIPLRGYPRFDNPYAQQAWGDPVLEVRFGGATLRHDRRGYTRSGTGL